ncbi:unnamed protein product [Moneuplotes crassus]|uniref:Uncharacterized protein n=1 Tax=Euplotes crassus TaxID=5936 RepID=A0AAD2D3C5_EUPCR|nr:unnamed protein product [Moneuplotes crassus]
MEQTAEQASDNNVWHEDDNLDVTNFDTMIENMAMEYPFELDIFQKRAVYRVENSQSVLVSAHTSAGKTVVAEYAIAKSLQKLMKCVYTSPIKALSNQKYKEFKEKFEDVGILTGDVTLNEEASCLIMTTEVLQSMLYRGSEVINDIDCVVFDEAHYLADPDRGYVWEEVIIMLPEHINIVLLSATIPNYKELADWVGRVRRKKVYIEITYYRPVPLNHYILSGRQMVLIKEGDNSFDRELVKKIFFDAQIKKDKASANKKGKFLLDKKKGGDKVKQDGAKEGEEQKVSDQPVDIDAIKSQIALPEKTKLTANEKKYQKRAKRLAKKMKLKHQTGGGGKFNKDHNDLKQNVSLIVEKELYPCVVFVFSKKQCSELCMGMSGIDALNSRERSRIKRFIKKSLSKLEEKEREIYQIREMQYCLEQGVAYHHAGLLPILKEIVEILFAEGLIKVLFATTTFAMGLNMPARAVMFMKLEKFNGKEEVFLQASEYLQMAGRAGRRGKDDTGYSLLYFEKADMFRHQGIADEMQDMMDVKSGSLESQYKLTYRIILFELSKGDNGMEAIFKVMKSSFLQNDSFKEKLLEQQIIKNLEDKLDSHQELEPTTCTAEEVKEYNSNLLELFNLNHQWVSSASPKTICFPALIEFTMDGYNYHIGTAIQNDKANKALVILTTDKIETCPYDEETKKEAGDASYNIVPYKHVTKSFANTLKTEVSYMDSVRLKYSSKQDILEELETIDKDSLKEPRAKRAKKGKGRGKKGGGGGGGAATGGSSERRNELIQILKSSPAFSDPKFAELLKLINSQATTQKEMNKMVRSSKEDTLLKNEEFTSKMQVLKELGFMNKEGVLSEKGRFAQHISSADLMILTIFVFEGGFVDLPDEEMIASLAMTMTKAGGGNSDDLHPDYLPSSFFENKTLLEEIAGSVIDCEEKFGVKDEQKEAEKRLNQVFPLVAYEWAKKTPFHEICNISFQEPGTMITALRSLVKLCEEMSQAYLIIENEEASKRFTKLSEDMRRGILFMPSLYYEDKKKQDEKKDESDEEPTESEEDSDEDSSDEDDNDEDDNDDEKDE